MYSEYVFNSSESETVSLHKYNASSPTFLAISFLSNHLSIILQADQQKRRLQPT